MECLILVSICLEFTLYFLIGHFIQDRFDKLTTRILNTDGATFCSKVTLVEHFGVVELVLVRERKILEIIIKYVPARRLFGQHFSFLKITTQIKRCFCECA